MPLTKEDSDTIQKRRTELEKNVANYLIDRLIEARKNKNEYTHFTTEEIYRFNNERINKLYVDDMSDKADEVRIVLEGLKVKFVKIKSEGKLFIFDDDTMGILKKLQRLRERGWERREKEDSQAMEKNPVYTITSMERDGKKYYFAKYYGNI